MHSLKLKVFFFLSIFLIRWQLANDSSRQRRWRVSARDFFRQLFLLIKLKLLFQLKSKIIIRFCVCIFYHRSNRNEECRASSTLALARRPIEDVPKRKEKEKEKENK